MAEKAAEKRENRQIFLRFKFLGYSRRMIGKFLTSMETNWQGISSYLLEGIYLFQQTKGVTQTMKRLVSLVLVLCMLLTCTAFGETLDDAQSDVLNEVADTLLGEEASDDVQTPAEPTQAPVNEDEIILPDADEITNIPAGDVNGPDSYRELVLLKPTDLVGTTLNETTVRIGWGSVAFATQYDVYRKLGGEDKYTLLASVPNNRLYYEDTTLVPGQVVYYRVRAVNVSYDGDMPKCVYSPESDTLPYITLSKPKLEDPRGLGAETVRLSWGSVTGATTYEVQTSTNATTGFTTARTDLTGTLCNITELKKATGYYFRVRAVRTFSSGEKFYSEYSNVGCGTPMDRPTLSVVQSGNSALLSWPASSGATGYIIYRKEGTSGSYSLLAKTGAVTSFVDASIKLGEVYYYFIYSTRPVGSYNCFSLSSERVVFTAMPSVNLCAVQNSGKQEQRIDWDSTVAGANMYYVYSSTTMDGLYTKIGETTETTYYAKDLTPGVTYYYKVRPVRVFNNGTICYGPWSNVMSQPESGTLVLDGLSATNLTAGKDVSGAYVGDVIAWNVKVSGGSGAYTFKYSLVSLNGGGTIVLQDFSDGYLSLPEGESVLTNTFTMTLTDTHMSLINNQKYAMQVEVRDSLGASAAIYAAPATYDELNFVAPAPVTKTVNKTIRVGQAFEIDHGIYTEAGDVMTMEVANTNKSISIKDNVLTGVNNGYATLLITSQRYPDLLIVYNITVGYAPLTISSINPSASTMNNYETLSWDINFSGGRPGYTVNFKVYKGNTVIVNSTRTESKAGQISVNYQPTSAGTYLLEVTITAADGQTTTLRSGATIVSSYTPVTVVPSVTAGVTGQNLTWTAAYKGTSTVIRRDYTLFRDGAVIATEVGLNNLAFNYTPTLAGSYVLRVVVYEASGNKIEVTAPTITVTQAGASSGNGVVNGVRVALRKGAGTNFGVILRVDKGETVTVLEKSGNWYKITYKGTTGWMMAKYVTLN